MTPPTRETIDRIVREVLARLSDTSTSDDTLVLTASVVSTAVLEGRLDGVRRVVVSPTAVVTPAVVDLLAERGIEWTRGETSVAVRPVARVVLAVVDREFEPESLVRKLQEESIQVDVEPFDCHIQATDRLALATASGDGLGLLLTRRPTVALCLANRHDGVRAVWGTDRGRLTDDLDAVGGNLLVVDPSTLSPFVLGRIVSEFCRRGIVAAPEALKERLA